MGEPKHSRVPAAVAERAKAHPAVRAPGSTRTRPPPAKAAEGKKAKVVAALRRLHPMD